MGVDYYKCDYCGYCVYEEYISTIEIEHYGEISICVNCIKEYIDTKPNEFVEINGKFVFEAFPPNKTKPTVFKKFGDLREWILEEHPDWSFGVDGKYCKGNNREELEKLLKDLESRCQQEVWENFQYPWPDYTEYKPKKKWIDYEYESVISNIEKLQNKKRKLEENFI